MKTIKMSKRQLIICNEVNHIIFQTSFITYQSTLNDEQKQQSHL